MASRKNISVNSYSRVHLRRLGIDGTALATGGQSS